MRAKTNHCYGRNPDAPMQKRTHCPKANHDLDAVGKYKDGTCKACKKAENAARAKASGGWRAMKARRKANRVRPGQAPKTGSSEAGPDHTNRLIDLDCKMDRAAMWWERDEIQREIDAILKRTA